MIPLCLNGILRLTRQFLRLIIQTSGAEPERINHIKTITFDRISDRFALLWPSISKLLQLANSLYFDLSGSLPRCVQDAPNLFKCVELAPR